MAPTPSSNPNDWYLLHVRMQDISDPIIWRQLAVPPNITTSQLHPLMISAFGWALTHLHMWSIHAVESVTGYEPPLRSDLNPTGYSRPIMHLAIRNVDHPRPDLGPDYDPDGYDEYDDDYGLPPDETLAELDALYDLSGGKHVLIYEYDLGDGWEHVITVEKRVSPTPVITGGKGHGPAEDAGGTYGWAEVKEAYKVKDTDRDNSRAMEKREWYENTCSNADKRGLNGMARLQHVGIREVNDVYKTIKKRIEEGVEEDMWL